MKKTLIALLALGGVALAATTQTASTTLTGGTVTGTAGTTYGQLTLTEDMTTGKITNCYDLRTTLSSVDITGGNLYAGDYTVSLWLTTSQLKNLSSNMVLFVYSAGLSSGALKYNGITFNTDNTITVGRGEYTARNNTMTYDTAATSTAKSTNTISLTEGDELINLTFSSTSDTSGNQTVTVWVNGEELETLGAYAGKMNGSLAEGASMTYLFDTDTTYGRIAITNAALTTAHDIAVLATPEPATATLSLLALAGLAARRRRH